MSIEQVVWSIIMGILVFMIGASIGSFLNVLLYRKARGQDWVRERSQCEKCHHQIAWYDNIPVLSWLLLRGKCRHCGSKIELIHPVMEILMGVLFVWWLIMGSFFFRLVQEPLTTIQPLYWLGVGVILVVIFIIDWNEQIIPDWANGFLIGWTIAYRLILSLMGSQQWTDFWWAIVSAIVVGLLFYGLHSLAAKIYQRDAFGLGDVKFIVAMGLILGWPKIMIALLVAFGLGALIGLGLILSQKKDRHAGLPFGPFLVIGTVVALIWGQQLFNWWLSLI